MSLKNLMEDKKLNFNQPLLSIRRNSYIVASGKDSNVPQPPRYKSELKSGPVSNPAVVPFFWERIPGKPKVEIRQQGDDNICERTIPKLPPGRISVANDSVETIKSGSSNSLKAMIMEDDDENYESGDEGEVFVDALDTLSRAESSVFLNCSESGLDGKPSGAFLTDPQTREYMISRFLPAAKAMASEIVVSDTPHYAHRKQSEVKAVMPDRQPQLQRYYQTREYEEETYYDDDDDYDRDNIPPRSCGLLPRFCFRSSLCLMNPLPGISVRTRVAKPTGKANNDSLDVLSSPKKVCKSFRELLAAEDSSVQEDSGDHVAEKTLYVDTIHKLESPIPKSCSPEIKEISHLSKVVAKEEEKLLVDQEAKIMCIVQENRNLDSLSTNDKLNYKVGNKPGNDHGQAQHYYEETLTSVKADNESNKGSLRFIEFPVPPPLPKSPSDSWLCRTLPSLSTKNSAFHPQRNRAPKWETIVITTNQHLQSSEEHMAFRPIPEAL